MSCLSKLGCACCVCQEKRGRRVPETRDDLISLYIEQDKEGLNLFQRAAKAHSAEVFRSFQKESAKRAQRDQNQEQEFSKADSYYMTQSTKLGVSLLALALMSTPKSPNVQVQQKRQRFINYLITELKTPINTLNLQTFWAPIHWACLYGETKVVEIMIEQNVNAFTPTCQGLFPIDIAGCCGHENIVRMLVKHSIQEYKKTIDTNTSQVEQVPVWNKDVTGEQVLKHLKQFILNPVYATTLLFWSAKHRKIDEADFQFVLTEMESYPEACLHVGYQQTPIHAACQSNQPQRLMNMIENFRERWEQNKKINENNEALQKNANQQKSGCFKPKFEFKFQRKQIKVLPMIENVEKMNEIHIPPAWNKQVQVNMKKSFELTIKLFAYLKNIHFQQYDNSAQNWYPEVKDYNQNAGLQMAARAAALDCCKIMIAQNVEFNSTNLYGVQVKNTGLWHPEIQDLFQVVRKDLILEVFEDEKFDQVYDRFDDGENTCCVRVPPNVKKFEMASISYFMEQIVPTVLKCELIPTDCFCCKRKDLQDQRQFMNRVIQVLLDDGFKIKVLKSVYPNSYLVTLDLPMEDYCYEAELQGISVRLEEQNQKKPFKASEKNMYSAFFSKHKQRIIENKLYRLLPSKYLSAHNIDIMHMHNAQEAFQMYNSQYFLSFLRHLSLPKREWVLKQTIFRNNRAKMIHQDLITEDNYLGEYETIMHNFKRHHFVRLLPLLIFGIIVTVNQWRQKWQIDTKNVNFNTKSFDWYLPENDLTVIYTLILTGFYILNHEVWKRHQIKFTKKIGKDPAFKDEKIIDPEFEGVTHFDWKEKQPVKQRMNNTMVQYVLWWIGLVILFVALTCASIFPQYYIGARTSIVNYLGMGIAFAIVCWLFEIIFWFALEFYMPLVNIKFLEVRKRIMITVTFLYKALCVHIPIVAFVIYRIDKIKSNLNDYNTCNETYCVKTASKFSLADCTSKCTELNKVVSGVVDSAGQTRDPYDLLYADMYQFLFGIVCTRILLYVGLVYVYPLVVYWVNHTFYFNKIAQKARVQAHAYTLYAQDTKADQKTMCGQLYSDLRQNKFFDEKIVKQEDFKDKKRANCCTFLCQSRTYLRYVLNLEKTQETQLQPVDEIEMNCIRSNPSELWQFSCQVDIQILITLGILYAGLNPFISILSFALLALDNQLDMWFKVNVYQRQKQNPLLVMKTWVQLEELICLLAIITNTYLLYEVSQNFRDFCGKNKIKELTGVGLYTVVVIQHAYIVLIMIIRYFWPAQKPPKVQSVKSNGSENENRIRELEQMNEQMRRKLQEMQNRPGKFAYFLGLNQHDFFSRKYEDAVETALQENFTIRLFRETFYQIERAILSRKLSQIGNLSKTITIGCCDCKEQSATMYCKQCEDYRCSRCNTETHNEPQLKPHTPEQICLTRGDIASQGSKMQGWVKLENFNFPVNKNSALHQYLQQHFSFLSEMYFDLNYMDKLKNKTDVASVLIDQTYEVIEQKAGKRLMNQHEQQFGKGLIINKKIEMFQKNQEGFFNYEELYYMNRIAYQLFKERGSKATFAEFVRGLQTLQEEQNFETRVAYWVNLMIEAKNYESLENTGEAYIQVNNIPKQNFINVVQSSFIQDLKQQFQPTQIIDKLYGQDDKMPATSLIKRIQDQNDAKQMVQALLQFK